MGGIEIGLKDNEKNRETINTLWGYIGKTVNVHFNEDFTEIVIIGNTKVKKTERKPKSNFL